MTDSAEMYSFNDFGLHFRSQDYEKDRISVLVFMQSYQSHQLNFCMLLRKFGVIKLNKVFSTTTLLLFKGDNLSMVIP